MVGPLVAPAADRGPDLLIAAKKGQTAQVEKLLDQGAPVEGRDKDGRTALMLAAEHGHPATVRLLLGKGAQAGARDEQGWDAFALALLSTAKGRKEVLDLLPQRAHVRLALEVTWGAADVYSSCFLNQRQLAERVADVRPDAMVASALREFAAAADPTYLEIGPGDGDLVLRLRVRPGATCVAQQTGDNLRMEIDVRLARSGNDTPAFEKTFGGGLKGLKARTATSPAQYPALYEEWAKSLAAPVYWGVAESLLKQAR